MHLPHYGEGVSLGDIIDAFEKLDPNTILPIGLAKPHSYRGDYTDLAFEAVADAKVADVLDILRSCVGETFEGYKGGDYHMTRDAWCWITPYGHWAACDRIGPVLLHFLTHQVPVTAQTT